MAGGRRAGSVAMSLGATVADRYVVVSRGFRYPVGDGDARIKRAGGLSKMAADQLASIRFKDVGIGDDCSDMPAAALALYLERGNIARVEKDEA